MIDRSTGGTSLPDGIEGDSAKADSQAPAWFINLAKRLLFQMEYGQPYSETAQELWQKTYATFAALAEHGVLKVSPDGNKPTMDGFAEHAPTASTERPAEERTWSLWNT